MAATRSGSSSHLKTSSTGAARSTDPARWIIPSGVYRPYSPVISESQLVRDLAHELAALLVCLGNVDHVYRSMTPDRDRWAARARLAHFRLYQDTLPRPACPHAQRPTIAQGG